MLRALLVVALAASVGCSNAPPKPTIGVHNAAKAGDLAQLKRHVYHGCDLAAEDDQGGTPLLYACMNNKAATVAFLLDNGVTIGDDMLPLTAAVRFGSVKLVKLVESKTDPLRKAFHSDFVTAAVEDGKLEVVEYLARQSKNPCKAALSRAVVLNRPDAVKVLLECGTKPGTFIVGTEELVGEYADRHGFTEVAAVLKEFESR